MTSPLERIRAAIASGRTRTLTHYDGLRRDDLAMLVALADAVGAYRSGDRDCTEDDLWNKVRNAHAALTTPTEGSTTDAD